MPNARVLPSGNYRCRSTWTDRDGIRHTKSFTAKTKKEAERLAADYEFTMTASASRISFLDAATAYIESRSNTLSPTTINEYRNMLRRGFPFQDKNIHEITEIDIQRFVNDYAATHSPKTVKNTHGFVVSVIHSVRPDFFIKTRLPQKKTYEANIPEDDDIKKILAVSDPELKKAIYLAALGPMRRSEVCGASYEDLKRGTLHVHTVMVKNGTEWILKDVPKTTASDRYIRFLLTL
ncbi:MAG: site-specific integrase [Lachnospiraceae bacterium]|nr:site-specific integrase [Lachnospiraceae bacterium]